MASAHCSNRGALVDGACQCVVMWHGPRCEEPFAAKVGPVAWDTFALFGACANAVLFLFMALCLAHKFLLCRATESAVHPRSSVAHANATQHKGGAADSGTRRVSSASEAGSEPGRCARLCWPCRHGNARDASMLANMVACGLRMGFFASPYGSVGVLDVATTSVLLRIPQAIWMACFAHLFFLWSRIISKYSGHERRTSIFNRVLLCGVVLVVGTAVPCTIMYTWAFKPVLMMILPDIVIAVFAAVMTGYMAFHATTVRGFLRMLRRGRDSVDSERRGAFSRAATVLVVAGIGGSACGVVIMVLSAAMVASGFDAFRHPWYYFAYIVGLHDILECIAATVLAYANLQSTHRWWGNFCCAEPPSTRAGLPAVAARSANLDPQPLLGHQASANSYHSFATHDYDASQQSLGVRRDGSPKAPVYVRVRDASRAGDFPPASASSPGLAGVV